LKRGSKYISTYRPEEVAGLQVSRALSGKSCPKEPDTQACTLGRKAEEIGRNYWKGSLQPRTQWT